MNDVQAASIIVKEVLEVQKVGCPAGWPGCPAAVLIIIYIYIYLDIPAEGGLVVIYIAPPQVHHKFAF